MERYFKAKKNEWNVNHADIRICGFPVEVYVQDIDDKVSSSGIYSLDKDEWIKEPVKGTFTKKDINSDLIKKSAANLMTKIEKLEDESRGLKKDSNKSDNVYDKADNLINKIMSNRKETLSVTKDEMNPDNIVFKTLRRNGYLDKLFNIRDKSYDKRMSLA